MNQRVIVISDIATVRYIGPLKHKESDPEDIWYGLEWDDPERGKHSGTVENYTYFTAKHPKGGSLIRKKNIEFGQDIIQSLQRRYFKNSKDWLLALEKVENEQDVKDQIQKLEDQNLQDKEQNNENNNQEETNLNEDNPEKKEAEIQLDEDAYFKTANRKGKIQVEFYGFLDIWQKINDLQNLEHLSLCDQLISSLENPKIGILLQKLKELSLEQNLLHSWQQINLMIPNFQKLQILSLSGNKLNFENFTSENSFPELKRIILVRMGLTFTNLNQVLPLFKNASEMVLCHNLLSDTHNFDPKNYMQKITFLNLENNEIQDYTPLDHQFINLPKLEKLTLTQNNLSKFVITPHHYPVLTNLSLESNKFEDFIFLDNLQDMNLVHFRNKGNPIQTYGKDYVFQRTIAQIGKMQYLNGVQIKPYERKDSEIHYLRETFHQFFQQNQCTHINYDYEALMEHCKIHHVRIPYLINKYGNPYEKMPDQPQDDKQTPYVSTPKQGLVLNILPKVGKNAEKNTKKKFPLMTGIVHLKKIAALLSGLKMDSIVLKIGLKSLDMNSQDTLVSMNIQNQDVVEVYSL